MRGMLSIGLLAALALSACGDESRTQSNATKIKVRSSEQEQLHTLDASNLAIGLKRAIYDAGYTCNRITDAGFVGTWQNLDMWMGGWVSAKGAKRGWVSC